jgi:hypothetical protein
MECNFCKSILKTVSSLNYHMKNNKKCIEIQSKTVEDIKTALVDCEYCGKSFSATNINKHAITCKIKKKIDIDKGLIEFEILQNKNKEIEELNKKLIIKNETLTAENEKFLKPVKPKNINEDMSFKLILENGEIMTIGIRSDGYINATQLCKAAGKKFNDYQRIKQTEDYLQALSFNTGIPVLDLINSNVGGNHSGTYVHRKVGYHLAQWLSPSFAVQVSNVLDNLFITGKLELDNEKSNTELENIYQEKINKLQNKLKNYETTIFNRNIDYCPIEYYSKDVVYFIKFNIPVHLSSEYISKYPNIDNEEYSCIEFGVTSNIEERLKSHKRDKKKENLIFLHAIEIKKRYTASKMEFYIKRISQQLNIKFEYEKKKECIIVNEEMFNVLVNKINTGLTNIEENEIDYDEYDDNKKEELEELEECEILKKYTIIDKEIEIKKIEKDIELKKFESITDLFKNNKITIEDYKELLKLI